MDFGANATTSHNHHRQGNNHQVDPTMALPSTTTSNPKSAALTRIFGIRRSRPTLTNRQVTQQHHHQNNKEHELPARPPTPRDPVLDADWPWGSFDDPQPHGTDMRRARDAELIDAAFEAYFGECDASASTDCSGDSVSFEFDRTMRLPTFPESVIAGLFGEEEEACRTTTDLPAIHQQSKPIVPVGRDSHVRVEVNEVRVPLTEAGRLAPMLLWRSRLMEKPLQPSRRPAALKLHQLRKKSTIYLR